MKCPYCAEEIQDAALKCKHCGEWIKKESAIDNIKNAFNATKTFAVQAKESIYGANHYYKPTDTTPFELESLSLFDSFFTIGDKKYNYTQISNLYYCKRKSTQSVNSLPLSSNTYNSLMFLIDDFGNFDNPDFKISGVTSTIILNVGLKKIKDLQIAYDILNTKATSHISKLYKDKLEAGLLQYGDVSICNDGTIQKGNLTMNLKTARQNNGLILGTTGINFENPYGVLIRESNGWFAPKIKFNAYWDNEVLCMTLLGLAGALK